jgi:hypothetical protein
MKIKLIESDIKPAFKKGTPSGKKLDNFVKSTEIPNLTEDELNQFCSEGLNENDNELKRKIFNLNKMEGLVQNDEFLAKKYEEMAFEQDARSMYGYHWNEVVMNLLFNEYVLNNPNYLRKYKKAAPAKRKYRGKIKTKYEDKMKDKSVEKEEEIEKTDIDETTTSASSGQYSSPHAFAKNKDNMRFSKKPIYTGGQIVETIRNEKYMANPDVFMKALSMLNETINEDHLESKEDKIGFILTHEADKYKLEDLDSKSDSEIDRIYNELESKAGVNEMVGVDQEGESTMVNTKDKDNTSTMANTADDLTLGAGLSEDRKLKTMVDLDRIKTSNSSNFKDYIKNDADSISKQTVDNMDKAGDQYETIEDSQKMRIDIEKEAIKNTSKDKALEDKGDSIRKGNNIPKRNETDEEKAEKALNRGMGLEDIDFDIEPNEDYIERMKKDMGDDKFKEREAKLKYRKDMPMYNKDKQPVVMENFVKTNTIVDGKYYDELNRTIIKEFDMSTAKAIDKVTEDMYLLDLNGFGNAVLSDGMTINESVKKMINTYQFYTNENELFYTKAKETTQLNENFLSKLNHLIGYNPVNYVSNKGNKRNSADYRFKK